MKEQTILANRLDTTGNMVRYDESCKKILSNKIILAWIMKHCLKEYKEFEINDIIVNYIDGDPEISKEAVHRDEEFIEGLDTEDASISEGTVTFDIKFSAILPDDELKTDMYINLEAQNDFYPGYPIVKRGIYYSGRMLSSQYGTVFMNEHYEKIKKVNSIWICTDPPAARRNTITRYAIEEENVFGNVKEEVKNYDLISVVMVCLGKENDNAGEELVRMLSVLLSKELDNNERKTRLEQEFDIPMTEDIEREVGTMCNLSKGVFNAGYDSGMKKQREIDEKEIEEIRKVAEENRKEKVEMAAEIARLNQIGRACQRKRKKQRISNWSARWITVGALLFLWFSSLVPQKAKRMSNINTIKINTLDK